MIGGDPSGTPQTLLNSEDAESGGVAEWSIAPVLKTGRPPRVSRVRISPPPLQVLFPTTRLSHPGGDRGRGGNPRARNDPQSDGPLTVARLWLRRHGNAHHGQRPRSIP